jgi:Skp family chaperone for outer membrane proteins
VKSRFIISAIVASLSFAAAHTASAQGVVAVLDVNKVFTLNQEFDLKIQQIRDEAESLKAGIQQKQEKIRNEAMQLQTMTVGTPDRNQLEASLEQQQTALRTEARQAEADLLNKEAKLYYDTYQKMQGIVAQLAEKNNISLVLRFDSESIDPNNRPEVIMGVNRAVVYNDSGIDLTLLVLNAMGPQIAAKTELGQQSRLK